MTTNTSSAATKDLARVLIVLGLVATGIAGCAPATTPRSNVTVSSAAPLPLQTIGQILSSDPRFTDYVRVIDFAGLGHRLEDAHDVTVFAPTNTAFAHADPNWRTTDVSDSVSNGGAWAQKRQRLIEQSFLNGIHPPSDFAGQKQNVRAMNGSIFHVDGSQPGAISITTGPALSGMGFRDTKPRIAKVELPPINAKDGIIYPVDNILIR
jgi:uncharacterized surface protein with fasciclin (FAS1) repeats